MKKKFLIFLSVILFFVFSTIQGNFPKASAAEKLKLASAVKLSSKFYLPILAAEEKGIWERNGLDVKWVPFKGGYPMNQAVTAGSISIGLSTAAGQLRAAVAGVPVVIVSELHPGGDWSIWVRTAGPIKEPKDLKGAKIGVVRLGGTAHAYGLAVSKRLGLEKDMKIIAIGGPSVSIASLKAKITDGAIHPVDIVINLKVEGVVRKVLTIADYLPKPWVAYSVFATRKFVQNQPDTVSKVIKSLLQATDFIGKNPIWAINKMKSLSRYSDKAARAMYDILHFSKDGRISRKGLENVLNFLIDYRLIKKENVPPVETLYNPRFTGLKD